MSTSLTSSKSSKQKVLMNRCRLILSFLGSLSLCKLKYSLQCSRRCSLAWISWQTEYLSQSQMSCPLHLTIAEKSLTLNLIPSNFPYFFYCGRSARELPFEIVWRRGEGKIHPDASQIKNTKENIPARIIILTSRDLLICCWSGC